MNLFEAKSFQELELVLLHLFDLVVGNVFLLVTQILCKNVFRNEVKVSEANDPVLRSLNLDDDFGFGDIRQFTDCFAGRGGRKRPSTTG